MWRYNKEKHCVDEQPTWTEADFVRSIPVSGKVDWKDGEDVTGKFKAEKRSPIFLDGNYTNICVYCKKYFFNTDRLWFACKDCCDEIVAIPIKQEQPQSNNDYIKVVSMWDLNNIYQKQFIMHGFKTSAPVPEDKFPLIKKAIEQAINQSQEQTKQEAIEDAEKFVEENFKGLSDFIDDEDILIWYKALIVSAITDYHYKPKQEAIDFQSKVYTWLMACFGEQISNDKIERNHRFLEESLELIQSLGCTQSEAMQLVDYVFNRPIGKPEQEVGGVIVTLAALCSASKINMQDCGNDELKRVWQKIDKVREKQANKPAHSPLAAQPKQEAIEKQIAERIAGYIHEIDSLRLTNHELGKKIESDAVEFAEWIIVAQYYNVSKGYWSKIGYQQPIITTKELYKLFKK